MSSRTPDTVQCRFFPPVFPLVDALADSVFDDPSDLCPSDLPWIDLSTDLFIIPSRGAGRALREAFVRRAGAQGRGLLPAIITTPAQFLDAFLPDNAANTIDCLDAWDQVFANHSPEALARLFPAITGQLSETSRLSAAKRITGLRETLARSGHTLETAALALGAAGNPSRARWDFLARLETGFCEILGKMGWVDPSRPPDPAAAIPLAFQGIQRIHLCGDPEPSPRLISTLQGLANVHSIAVRIRIPGGPDDADSFDPWGRPRPGHFSRRLSPLSPDDLTTAADPDSFAAAIIRSHATTLPKTGGRPDLAIGAADPAIVPAIRGRFERAGIPAYDPAGIPLSRTGGHAFFRRMLDWLGDGSIASLHAWLHLPLSGEWLESGMLSAQLIDAIDGFRVAAVPVSITSAAQTASDTLRPILYAALHWCRLAREDSDFPRRLRDHFLITARRAPDAFDKLFPDARSAQTLIDALNRIAAHPRLASSGLVRLRIALHAVESAPVYPESRPSGIEILGWREWIWNADPRLIVTGLAEGVVPESFRGDPFLNESERASLGLPTAATRLERDAAIFHWLCSLRCPNRSLCVVHCTTHSANDPTRPSRLLFQVPDHDLPNRVRSLFGATTQLRQREAPTTPHGFTLSDREIPGHFRVSELATWLDCPKRYLLKCIHKMDTTEPFGELSPRHFGTLVHACLEALNTDGADLCDPVEIRDALFAILDREVSRQFGPDPATIPFLQIRGLRRRLDHVAGVIATSRQEGWRPVYAEWSFGKETPWIVEGFNLRGTVDCIERHPATDRYRILDYKTSATPKKPSDRHFGTYPGHLDPSVFDPLEAVPGNGKTPLRWTDLQLPLYALAVRDLLGVEAETAYFNIPHDPAETAIIPFDEDGPALRESARNCAGFVIRSIHNRVFEPARRKSTPGDPFTAITVEDLDQEFKVAR